MRFLSQSRLTLAVIFVAFLGLLTFGSSYLVKNSNETKTPDVKTSTKPAENSPTNPTTKISDGTNSVKVDIDNSTKINQNNSTSTSNGTCTITKNGVTTTLPADQVNINEKSSGDINVKVDCNTVSNSSKQSSVKNDVNVKVNTSN